MELRLETLVVIHMCYNLCFPHLVLPLYNSVVSVLEIPSGTSPSTSELRGGHSKLLKPGLCLSEQEVGLVSLGRQPI